MPARRRGAHAIIDLWTGNGTLLKIVIPRLDRGIQWRPGDSGFRRNDKRSITYPEVNKGGKVVSGSLDKVSSRGYQPVLQHGGAMTEKQGVQDSLPLIDFPTFLLSLATSAQVHLGAIPNPTTGKEESNLSLAKETIDLLSMLRDKTKGNLTSDEERLFEHVLYDLRMMYVEKNSK